LTAGTIISACVYWLMPFHANVEATAMILCGGELGFSQMGGTVDLNTVVIMNTSDFVSDCSSKKTFNDYLNKYYGVNISTSSPPSNHSYGDVAGNRDKATLAFAYQDCPAGQIMGPNRSGKDRECTEMNEALKEVLKNLDVEVGGNHALPPTCPQFDPEQPSQTCNSVPPVSCAWSWQAYKCERNRPPPGYLQQAACTEDLEARDVLYESCHIWQDLFNTTHPSANCDILDKCSKSTDCLTMAGQLELTVRRGSVFQANPTETQAALANGLSRALGIPRYAVTILQIHGRPYNWLQVKDLIDSQGLVPSRRLQAVASRDLAPWEYGAPDGDGKIVVTNNVSQAKFIVSALPVSLLPSSIPEREGTLLAQLNTELGNDVLSRAEFRVWYEAGTKIVQMLKKVVDDRTSMCRDSDNWCRADNDDDADACADCERMQCDSEVSSSELNGSIRTRST